MIQEAFLFKPAIPATQEPPKFGQSLSRLELLFQFSDLALELNQHRVASLGILRCRGNGVRH